MSHPTPETAAAEAVRRFVGRVPSDGLSRLEAQVSSRRGMPLLCAVEAVLDQAALRIAALRPRPALEPEPLYARA